MANNSNSNLESRVIEKFNVQNKINDVTLESFQENGEVHNNTVKYKYVLKYKNNFNEYNFTHTFAGQSSYDFEGMIVSSILAKAQSLVDDYEKQQHEEEKKEYLASQKDAINMSINVTKSDSYYEIYEQYNKVINLFNSIDGFHRHVIKSKYNQGFKIVLMNLIESDSNNKNITNDTLEKIATELKKLWDVCKKNNYVVNSDGTANKFPCHIREYNIKDASEKNYIEYNKFRVKSTGKDGKLYDNGEILLNEVNIENEKIKSEKRYFVNLLAPEKGVGYVGNMGFEWYIPVKNPQHLVDAMLKDKEEIVDYPSRYRYEIGAPFGIEISKEEYNNTFSAIKKNGENVTDDVIYQKVSFLIYDDCDFGFNLINEIEKTKKSIDEIEESVASTNEVKKRDLLAEAGMPPTLGDLFKTIMCHLETFTNMIFTCSQIIYNQVNDKERDPDKLGINLNDTDIVNYDVYSKKNGITPVTPFPGIYRKQDYYSSNKDSLYPLREQPQDDIKSMSWTGEIDKNLEQKMEETLLVESIYEKITSVYNSIQESVGEEILASYDIMPYPILPTDLNHSLFPTYSTDRIDGLAAYLAFRISLLHYNKNIDAKTYSMTTIGEVDGFNYWETLRSRFGSDNGALNILKNINDQIGGLDKFDETIKQIVTCTSEDDRFKTDGRYIFERYVKTFGIVDTCNNDGTYTEGRGLKKSQRILSEDNIQYHYRYMEDIVDSSSQNNLKRFQTNKLIPIGIETFDELSNVVTPKRNDTGYLTFDIKSTDANPPTQNNVVICGTINHNPTGERIKDNVINNDMFRIFLDNNDKYGERAISQVRDNILDTYKDEDVEISGASYKQTFKLDGLRKNYFSVDDADFIKYFGSEKLSLYPNTAIQEEVTDITDQDCIYFPTDKSSIRIPNGYINSTKNDGNAKVDARIKYEENNTNIKASLYKENALLVGEKNHLNDEYKKIVGDGTIDLKTLKLRDFEIYIGKIGSQAQLVSLFGSQLYYKLNFDLQENQFACDAAKAFLFLHTLKYDLKNIYKSGNGMISINGYDERPIIVPYGGLLLEGALIYRYRYWCKTERDLLSSIYNDGSATNTPDDGCGLLFVGDGTRTIPTLYSTNAIQVEKSNHFLYKNLAVSTYDLYVQNELLNKFEDFVKGDWQTIKQTLELKREDGRVLSVEEFDGFVNTLKSFIDSSDVSSVWQILNGSSSFDYISDEETQQCKLRNFVGNYWYVKPTPNGNLQLRVYEGNTLVNDLFYNIYLSKILVSSTVGYNTSTTLSIGKSAFDNYLNGFKKTIMGIYNANSEAVTEEPHQEDTTQLDKNVDLRIGIYMYIKNLWDRWLLHSNNMGDIVKDNPYSVKNYFCNFIFCDSFYRNMYNMVINMEHAAEMISNDSITDAPRSLHSYLGYIAQENKCMFLALPDTVDLGNPDIGVACKNMDSLFTPYTWREKNPIRHENTFLVMHVYTDSGVIGEQKEAAGEGFDLYSFNDGQNVSSMNNETKELFKYLMGDKEKNLRDIYKKNPNDPLFKLNMQKIRYGYNVPSFGVAFSRQNNSIFKAINVNMDTPMVTEVYSKTYEDIVNKASGNAAHITFYGQDLYPVFQNYSYQCEVEMMGNAQITPMMYIQLLNIPLFRGAYMITSVQHEMKPGYMTTKFKAVKMSKRCPRYVDSAYVETNGAYGGVSGGGSAGSGTYIDTSYGISYGCNGFDITKAKQGGYNYKMPSDKAYPGKTVIEKPKNASSSMCVAGVWTMLRAGNPKIYPGDYWTGYSSYLSFEKNFVTGENQLYKLVAKRDHTNENDASIPYTKKEWQEWFTRSGYCNSPCCVMFMTKADYLPRFNTSMPMSQQTEYRNTIPEFNPNNYTNKTEAAGHGCWWDNNAGYWVSDMVQYYADEKPPYSYSIPYKGGSRYWRLYVLNEECVGNGKMEVTSNIKENTQNQEKNEEVKKRGIEVMTRLHNEFSELTVAQAAGIAGVWGHESGGWNPNAYYEKGNSAFGLAQWEKIRTGGSETNHEGDFVLYLKSEKTNEYEQIKNLGVNEIHEYFKTHYKTIESQIKFAKFEMKHIPQFTDNNGNKCNVLGNTANYSTSRVYNTGNILSVTAPYDSDHSKNTYEDNKNAIDDVVRRFLLGYEMQNQPPSPHTVHMEERCGYAKIAFDLAIKNKIWSEIL